MGPILKNLVRRCRSLSRTANERERQCPSHQSECRSGQDVRRVVELDDGKRTNDYNVGGSVSERMRINKDGKTSHRISTEAHAGAGTKRIIKLDDGKRTNIVSGEVESSHLLKVNQNGTKTQETKLAPMRLLEPKR